MFWKLWEVLSWLYIRTFHSSFAPPPLKSHVQSFPNILILIIRSKGAPIQQKSKTYWAIKKGMYIKRASSWQNCELEEICFPYSMTLFSFLLEVFPQALDAHQVGTLVSLPSVLLLLVPIGMNLSGSHSIGSFFGPKIELKIESYWLIFLFSCDI